MKVYLADYGYFPSSPESSVVIAENVEEVQAIILAANEDVKIKFTASEPRDHSKCKYSFFECQIAEVAMKKGIVYTGTTCC